VAVARNIVLTGFMGTGKSSVGRELARRLRCEFLDMDLLIEEREERSISEIFATQGEGYFRALERDLCRELAAQSDLVIATGGGALMDPINREVMGHSGVLFCLRCNPDEILRRLALAEDRPLLDVEDRRQRIEVLLAQRREAYSAIPHQVETTGRGVEEIVEEILRAVEGEDGDDHSGADADRVLRHLPGSGDAGQAGRVDRPLGDPLPCRRGHQPCGLAGSRRGPG